MPAPVVQSLDTILANLDPAYSGQEDVVKQQQGGLDAKYGAQVAGLDAAKTNSFHDINANANSKGLAFSGMPSEEQARYIGEKYLPAVAGLKTQQNTENMSLSSTLASLEGDKRLRALDTQGSQQKSLTDYLNQQEAQQQQESFDRWKIANDQAFTSTQNALNRNFTASQNTKNVVSPATAATGIITAALGSDGYVSPSTFNTARKLYVQAGGSAADFAKQYWNYTGVGGTAAQPGKGKNSANWKAYYYG